MSSKSHDLIQSIQPEMVQITLEKVKEVLASASWQLVPVWEVSGEIVLSHEKGEDMISSRRIKAWDLEEYLDPRGLYRWGNELAIFDREEAPEDWNFVDAANAALVLEETGYGFYFRLRQKDGVYHPYRVQTAPTRHIDNERNWAGHVVVRNGQLTIDWQWDTSNPIEVTFTPIIRGEGNTGVDKTVQRLLIEAVGLEAIIVTLDVPQVCLPIANYVRAGEWSLYTDQMPAPDAIEAAKAHITELQTFVARYNQPVVTPYIEEGIKALVVGRHTPDFGDWDVEVVSQEAPTFADDDSDAVEAAVWALMDRARELGANAVVFQNTPGVVTQALMAIAIEGHFSRPSDVRLGVVVSKAAPELRPAGVEFRSDQMADEFSAETARDAVEHANPRAKVEIDNGQLIVTVDPPMPFKFVRIAWLT